MTNRSTTFNRVVEASIIVGSILFAFLIDSMWDNFQEQEQEKQALQALMSELSNRAQSDSNYIDALSSHVESVTSMALIIEEQRSDENIDMLGITPLLPYSPKRSALNDIVGSGVYQSIRNTEVRLEIANNQKLLADLQKAQQISVDFSITHYMGFIMKFVLDGTHTNVGILEGAELEEPIFDIPVDFSALADNREFLNVTYFETGLTLQKRRIMEELQESTNILLGLLNSVYGLERE